MRKLFIERAKLFFESHMGFKGDSAFSLKAMETKFDQINIQKSKIVNLLPSEDLHLVASQPCFVDLWPNTKYFMNKKRSKWAY